MEAVCAAMAFLFYWACSIFLLILMSINEHGRKLVQGLLSEERDPSKKER
jgi:hypothetical protein